MGTRVVIDNRGVVQSNGSSSFTVSVPMTVDSISTVPTMTSMSAGNTTLSTPGFYYTTGNATGTLPAASTQPGAVYIFSVPSGDTGLAPLLTGSSGSSIDSSTAQIFFLSGSRGNNLVMPAKGSTMLTSDGKYWCVNQLSGSVALT